MNMKPIDWKALIATICTAFCYGYAASFFVMMASVTIDNLSDTHFYLNLIRGGLAGGIAASGAMVTRNFFASTETTKVDMVQLQPNSITSTTTTTTKEIPKS